MTDTLPVDLTDFGLWMGGDPHPLLRQVRESDPVFWHEAVPGNPFTAHPFWALTRYEDVKFASRNPDIFSSADGVIASSVGIAFSDYDTFGMLTVDDPQHSWMRALVSKAFTSKMVLGSEQHIRSLAREVLDAVAPQAHEEIDFVREVSARLPVGVIADLLGVPRVDAHLLAEWTESLTNLDDLEFDFATGTGHTAKGSAAVEEMFGYLEGMQSLRRDAATAPDDLVTRMLQAEVRGEKMTLRQQQETFFVLVTAGNDTTRNTISCGVKALADDPDQRRDLIADPQLLRPALEEMLRFGSVVTHFRRTALKDVVVGGKEIKAGDWVVLFYTAANRDPEAFPDPDRFDIRRSPNDHLAFGGGGPHFCLGAPLARLELRVLFEELLARYPSYAVTGPPQFGASNVFHGFRSLPVVLDPR